MALADKKCVACEGGVKPLSEEESRKMLAETLGWEIVDNQITRTFKFANFVEAMDFANKITTIAEEENHHPDLHISWGKVKVDLSTHKVGGLTENDFILAAKINKLAGE
jgi:4a-hydroxytetrahydrobiopterin dehydratase